MNITAGRQAGRQAGRYKLKPGKCFKEKSNRPRVFSCHKKVDRNVKMKSFLRKIRRLLLGHGKLTEYTVCLLKDRSK